MKEEQYFLKINNKQFNLSLFRFENAIVAFFYEKHLKLGTLAISMSQQELGHVGLSSTLLGEKKNLIARAIAEQLANKTGKLALVSIYFDIPDKQALKTAFSLIKKVDK